MASTPANEAKAAAKAAAVGWINSPGMLGGAAGMGAGGIPPIDFKSSSSATSGAGNGAKFAFDSSNWTVNVGGSGLALNTGGGAGVSPLILLAGAALAAFLFLRK